MKVRAFSGWMVFVSGLCLGVPMGVSLQLSASPWIALAVGFVTSVAQAWLLITFGEWRERRKWEDRIQKLDAIMHALQEKFGALASSDEVCPICNEVHKKPAVAGSPEDGEKHR